MALSLGRINVQSALGEPLRAEIDVPDINAEEANSLKASVALPDAFKAAGLDYSPAMAGLQVTVQKRPDGRTYIRLSSDRAINDPFVDMIIEASWSTGRIVRDYTMLFDPPALRQPPPPTPAQTPSPAGKVAAPASVAPSRTPVPAAEPAPKNAADTAVRTTLAKTPGTSDGQVTVKSGDTASKIAAAAKPANVSLDQMLVAMLRANPSAFAGENVNRVKAGAVMALPTAEQAGAIPAAQARQIIVAQSKDFNDYRRKLAGGAPTTQIAAAERQTSGTVQTQVEDKKPVTKAPDKLTLSKGAAVKGKLTEDQLANERIAKEATSRAAEISKNINDLSKLGVASNATAPGLKASAAVPAPTTPAAVATVATSTVSAASSVGAASTSPVAPANQAASASSPAASSPAKRPAVASDLPAQPTVVDQLIENPLVPAGAVGLIALLAAFGFYRARQRKAKGPADSVLDEGRLQPDSFFGASGGQSVDTNDSAATGSSMVYSPSQLEAADDVDPVAEADVYLAYGRDLQAEEILRSALGTNPGRIAIHLKLLEILAKRQDLQGFGGIATQAFKVTAGDGQEWERVCELGLSIDPSNPLYQPGGQPASLGGAPTMPVPLDLPRRSDDTASALATQAIAPQPSASVDLDLDLDFSLDDEASGAVAEVSASATEAAAPGIDMDFGLLNETPEPVEPPRSEAIKDAVDFSLPELELAGDGLALQPDDNEAAKPSAATDAGSANAAPAEASEPKAAPPADLDMLEFDLGSLSLDLGNEPPAQAPEAPAAAEDPLATKLALAQEFSAIGDDDGARALIEEVIAEASGDMKIKAQSALNNL